MLALTSCVCVQSFGTVIVIEGLPVATPDKYQKLYEFIGKLASAIGPIVENGINMPKNPSTGSSEG
jgi:translation initiation factor 3 subunit B